MRNLCGPIAFFLIWGCNTGDDSTVVLEPDPRPRPIGAAGASSSLPPVLVDAGGHDAGARDAGGSDSPGPDAAASERVDAGSQPEPILKLPVGIVGLPAQLALSSGQPGGTPPEWLSETGVFVDVVQGVPAASLIGYEVQAPLFSDGTLKSRWLALPEGTTIGFRAGQPWVFPEGTVFVKQFDMVLDEREPLVRTRLETRLLVAGAEGEFYGITYRWNDEGTDARLLLESTTLELSIANAQGEVRAQSYLVPGATDCMTCHVNEVGFALGVRTAQLRSAQATEQLPLDQLKQWFDSGLFDLTLSDEEILALPSLAPLTDETRSVEDRIRSYLDSNCAHCHGPRENFFIKFDARFSTPLPEQGIVWGETFNSRNGANARLVVPGLPLQSDLYLRDVSTAAGERMPPLARSTVDDDYIALLDQWIASLQGDSRFPAPM